MKKWLCAILMAFALLFCQKGLAQSWFNSVRRDQKQALYQNLFIYKTISFPDRDTADVVVYTKIANDLLQFVYHDSVFINDYEISVMFKNSARETAGGKIIRKRVIAHSFTETNSRTAFSREQIHFRLPAGEYRLFIELLDTETRTPIVIEEKITIPEFKTQSLAASGFLFFHIPDTSGFNLRDSYPVLPAARATADSHFTAVTQLHLKNAAPLEMTCRLLDRQDKILQTSTIKAIPQTSRHPVLIPLDQQLAFGQYTLDLDISDGEFRLNVKDIFFVKWGTHTTYLPSLGETIQIMQYIMDRNEWDALTKMPGEEQEKTLDAFWKERDPNPDTVENELEEEYFRRVAFVNQNLSPWQDTSEGWRTARGRIYILYGPPTEVERPTTSTGETSRYEIWYYRELQKRFVFFDKFGTEEYRLISEE